MYRHEHFMEHGLITAPEPRRAVPPPAPPELYNVREDPLERRNLASEHPQRVRVLRDMLQEWFDQVEAERRAIRD
jgi:hypothetical protein